MRLAEKGPPMTHAAIPAIFGAAFLAMVGAFFGLVMARLIWAEDLKQAQSIDVIRSKTEIALRSQIDSLERQLAVYRH